MRALSSTELRGAAVLEGYGVRERAKLRVTFYERREGPLPPVGAEAVVPAFIERVCDATVILTALHLHCTFFIAKAET